MIKDWSNRRDLLKGLLSVPIVAAVNAGKPVALGADGGSPQVILNVILHGAFAIEFDTGTSQVSVLAPAVKTHSYLAGHWLAENALVSGGSYQLGGMVDTKRNVLPPEIDDISSTSYAIVRGKLKRNNSATPFCTLYLPFPRSVKSGYSAYLDNHVPFFQAANLPLKQQPTQLPMVLVLEYTVALAGAPPPVLGTLNWVPCINLHVFAEPVTNPTGVHMADAFEALKNLYIGLDNLKLTADSLNVKKYNNANVPLPPCLSQNERLSLSNRKPGGGTPGGGAHTGTCLHLVIAY